MARNNDRRTGRGRRRLVGVVLALALGGGMVGYALAQSSISLSSPVSFPVDI
ncbi:MAG: hypothetical protein JJ899_10290 [Alphaproteobacteria bacterium]|nr:hypothetical protein [Alphaproteobacteria bacterium]